MSVEQGRTQLTRRYRAWYRTLPAGLQLVGLQLWLPLFFTVMFCLCYILAFHQPRVSNIPIGYVGTSAQAHALQNSLHGTIDVTAFGDAPSATAAVRSGAVAGAIEPAGSTTTLVIASAHQFQAASVIKQTLTPVLTASGATLKIDDLAPLPSHDLFGTVPLYLMLVTCIGGYMVGMFLGMMGGPLLHRTRLATLFGTSFVLSGLVHLLAGPIIGAVHGHFLELWAVSWAWMFTVGLVVNGAGYFLGRFIAALALAVFVFLSMPSSSGAYPAYFMREPFRWLNHVVVGSGITEMFRKILYDVGPGLGRGIRMLAVYFAVGVVLTVLGKPFWERRRVRAILAGRTTMFQDAQRANTERLQRARERIFRDAGVPLPEDADLGGAQDAGRSTDMLLVSDPIEADDRPEASPERRE